MVRRFRSLSLLFPVALSQWVGPLVATGVVAGIAAFVIASLGWLDLSASTPHPQGWASFLHYTFRRSVADHARGLTTPPEVYGDRLVRKGALAYAQECSHCHGGPGLGQNSIALAMRPTPQYLVTQADLYTPAQLFVILKHGVKYSAMPAWSAQQRDDEVWAMAAFVNRLPKMTPATYTELTATDPASAPTLAVPVGTPDARRRFVVNEIDNPGEPSGKLTPMLAFGASAAQSGVITCIQCHGVNGRGRVGTGVPNIALLNPNYIRTQLIAYATGARPSGFMQQAAASLTDGQITALSHYYSTQPKVQTLSARPAAALVMRGETIARSGLQSGGGVPACASCHGEEGASSAGFSALNGQHPAYLRDQLRLYRAGLRAAGPRDPMVAAARGLTDADIDAVAWFYAERQPGAPRLTQAN